MAISEDSNLLGEPLTLIKVEYQFPTNDRADILFLDKKARLLPVEVEVDVGATDIVGLLHAVKYRHMIMVQFGLTSGVRSMLVRYIQKVCK
jgi:RecB family endonuclease NucS